MVKICSKCGIEKDIDEFSLHSIRKDGYRDYCKKCCSIIKRKYRQTHKKEIAEYQAQYYQTHKKEMAEYYAEYRQTHKKEKAEYQARHYQNHKKEMAEYQTQYRQTRKKEIAEYDKRSMQELSNTYIKKLICIGNKLKHKDIPSEMVDLYRAMVLINREIKKINQGVTL